MDFVLQDLKDFAGAYVDDILVHTDTLEQHVVALRSVYESLDKANLFANPEKCVIAQSEVEYCGFIVGRNGIRPHTSKLKAVHVWPALRNATDVKSFLGLCGFYQIFVADYATVAAPLTDLMKKNVEWKWEDKQQHAFEELKRRLLQ